MGKVQHAELPRYDGVAAMSRKPKDRFIHDTEFVRLLDELLSVKSSAFQTLTVDVAVRRHKHADDLRERLINRNERRTKRADENAKSLKRIDDNHRNPLDGVPWT